MNLKQLSLFDPIVCQRWRGGMHTWRPVHEGVLYPDLVVGVDR
jgi:hypothetical protein